MKKLKYTGKSLSLFCLSAISVWKSNFFRPEGVNGNITPHIEDKKTAI
jgi:hypothetical protein